MEAAIRLVVATVITVTREELGSYWLDPNASVIVVGRKFDSAVVNSLGNSGSIGLKWFAGFMQQAIDSIKHGSLKCCLPAECYASG